MNAPLARQHALITGGGTGIGAAIALRLAALGASITVAGRRPGPLEQIVERLGKGHGHCLLDVGDEGAVVEAFAAARAARGEITILVNGAGIAETAAATRTSLEHWNRAISVNLTGVFLCSREFLLQLPKATPGRIVNIASTAGLKGYAFAAPYCAAKHGVIGYTRALAIEVARRPVTVNAVCPSFTDTPLLSGAIDTIMRTTGRTDAEAREELLRSIPQGRFIQPEEVAAAVAYLCQPDAASVTGTTVPIAGGEV